jgi:uracil-DNA glycosylase
MESPFSQPGSQERGQFAPQLLNSFQVITNNKTQLSHTMFMMTDNWESFLSNEKGKPYFIELQNTIARERAQQIVYPANDDVFRSFTLTSVEETKVLLLGQDPYHGEGQAHGLSFSVSRGIALPPSLRNIMKERRDDVGLALPQHGDLSAWAKQGVLLLNSALTVRHKEPGSHQNLGWETFTDGVLSLLNQKSTRVVFVLWGNFAQQKQHLVTAPHHVVLTAPHPSPLSAHRGFFGSRPFSRINAALAEVGLSTIDWATE